MIPSTRDTHEPDSKDCRDRNPAYHNWTKKGLWIYGCLTNKIWISAPNTNIFPMRYWHVKHMQDTVIKYLKGLPDDASRFDKKLYKRYSGITNVPNKLQYDLKHGATQVDLREFLTWIRKDESFSMLGNSNGFADRLNELESHFWATLQRLFTMLSCNLINCRFLIHFGSDAWIALSGYISSTSVFHWNHYLLTNRIFMSDLHFFLNLYPLLPKKDNKKILKQRRLILTSRLTNNVFWVIIPFTRMQRRTSQACKSSILFRPNRCNCTCHLPSKLNIDLDETPNPNYWWYPAHFLNHKELLQVQKWHSCHSILFSPGNIEERSVRLKNSRDCHELFQLSIGNWASVICSQTTLSCQFHREDWVIDINRKYLSTVSTNVTEIISLLQISENNIVLVCNVSEARAKKLDAGCRDLIMKHFDGRWGGKMVYIDGCRPSVVMDVLILKWSRIMKFVSSLSFCDLWLPQILLSSESPFQLPN